ncbi:MAG: DNA adenine methylase [Alphaproteobacteria bacterium]|nr:DNA adenine methylase [Alphaproteobacteria bacterium]MBL6951879.1 DNA adenine methylase [Alphaproteobacteria bacterium]
MSVNRRLSLRKKLHPLLEALHERLASVVIECLPWSEAIRRYDRPETLFYLDPPYWGSEGDYGKDLFAREDFTALAAQLAAIKGQFILSINDTPEIRQIFLPFTIEPVETTYTIAGNNKAKKAGELIITGHA